MRKRIIGTFWINKQERSAFLIFQTHVEILKQIVLKKLSTGEIKSKINNKTKGSTPPSGNPIFAFDDIYIGYTDYTLTMYDAKSNELKWNFTYSELRATESGMD